MWKTSCNTLFYNEKIDSTLLPFNALLRSLSLALWPCNVAMLLLRLLAYFYLWRRSLGVVSSEIDRISDRGHPARQPYASSLAMFSIGCQRVGTPGLGSRLSTLWPTKWSNKWRCSQHTSADQTPIPYVLASSPWLKPKGRVCEEWMLRRYQNRTSLAWAAKPITAATPRRGTSMVLRWWCGLSTRLGLMPTQAQVQSFFIVHSRRPGRGFHFE